MGPSDIVIRGARQHNLQGIELVLPARRLITLTGVSGSGKSSLAVDTLFKEAQRRFLRTLSAEARRLLGSVERPRVDTIEGLAPAVGLSSRPAASSRRSTVGTLSEIHDLLGLLFARTGLAHCSRCGLELERWTAGEVAGIILEKHAGRRCLVLAPAAGTQRRMARHELDHWRLCGFVRVRLDGMIERLDEVGRLDRRRPHSLEVVVDRLVLEKDRRVRLTEAITTAASLARGRVAFLLDGDETPHFVSLRRHCARCDRPFPPLEARLFSFNSPAGACPACEGRGETRAGDPCSECLGSRLNAEARAVTLGEINLPWLLGLALSDLVSFFEGLREGLRDAAARDIQAAAGNPSVSERTDPLLAGCLSRARFLVRLGLGYLTLSRSGPSLSGGELQRVRLAARLGADLQGVLYVLDEPSVGLHPTDSARLIAALHELRDQGNTVLVVEHDRDMMVASDQIVELGPGAGEAGGRVVVQGAPAVVARHPDSATARLLRGEKLVAARRTGEREPKGALELLGAKAFNLATIDLSIPLGCLTAVIGVSGSGKSTLVHEILYKALARSLHGAKERPGPYRELRGAESLARVVEVDQKPLGRSARSNPATATKLFDVIRDLFARTPEARMRGYTKARFSFNVRGGRCDGCGGAGQREIDLPVLGRVTAPCEACGGARYDPEMLDVRYHGLSIRDVLDLSVDQAFEIFSAVPRARRILDVMRCLGLGYMRLGQGAPSLSGGEAQRIKLAAELGRPGRKTTLYLLDEPTTGLHAADVALLLAALEGLADQGHTVLIVEHQMELVQACDHIIELGPGAGREGGHVVFSGRPEALRRSLASPTAAWLRRQAQAEWVPCSESDGMVEKRAGDRAGPRAEAEAGAAPPPRDIVLRGACANNLRSIDVTIPANRLTVVTGVAGAGKSSLVFATLHAEGQRRYVESLPTHAWRGLTLLERPVADRIEGLGPAVAVRRHSDVARPMARLAAVSDLLDPLRVLWARRGVPHCPRCGRRMESGGPSETAHRLTRRYAGLRAHVLAPLYDERLEAVAPNATSPDKRERANAGLRGLRWRGYPELLGANGLSSRRDELLRAGYVRVVAGGMTLRLDDPDLPWFELEGPVDLVIDRIVVEEGKQARLAEALEQAFARTGGLAALLVEDERIDVAARPACLDCGVLLDGRPGPAVLSTTSRSDRCSRCAGQGRIRRRGARLAPCPECLGSGIGEIGRAVRLAGRSLPELLAMRLVEVLTFLEGIDAPEESSGRDLGGERTTVCATERATERATGGLLEEVRTRLSVMVDCGLGHLRLGRRVGTLSAGEIGRARIAMLRAESLSGVLYVLEEPSVGLDPSDVARLVEWLGTLCRQGNTVVALEHDPLVIEAADHVIVMGPGAGAEGGQVVAAGRPEAVRAVLRGSEGAGPGGTWVTRAARRLRTPNGWLSLEGARWRERPVDDLAVPLGCLSVVCGPSGAGKTVLVMRLLRRRLEAALRGGGGDPDAGRLSGHKALGGLVVVRAVPPPARGHRLLIAELDLFDELRELFAQSPEARLRGYDARRFLLGRPGGRCEACQGRGVIWLDEKLFAETASPCDVCEGQRYDEETLAVTYRGLNISRVLDLSVAEAERFLGRHERFADRLGALVEAGLGYLPIGRPMATLSAGETQRLRLAVSLARRAGQAIAVLIDEPTVGLHGLGRGGGDVAMLLELLEGRIRGGATVVLIEHAPEVIWQADHVIELAPYDQEQGIRIARCGAPEEVAAGEGVVARGLRAWRDQAGRGKESGVSEET